MGKLKPVTPGELLLEDFLGPMGLSRHRLARETGVPPQRIDEIAADKRAITDDTDMRLCRFFGLPNKYGPRAQAAYDTEVAEDALAKAMAKIRPCNARRAKAGHAANDGALPPPSPALEATYNSFKTHCLKNGSKNL